MDILVTGGAGYVGSFLTKLCIDRGDKVVVVDDMNGGNKGAVDKKARLVIGDYGDEFLLRAIFDIQHIDLVIHTGASVSPVGSIKTPAEYFNNNVSNTIKLLDAMVKYGVNKIIYSSSACTYGIPERNPVREEDRKVPITPYGESKLMVEPILERYREAYGLEYITFRYFNIAGADGELGSWKPHHNGLIPNILKVVVGQTEEVSVYGGDYPTRDGSCIRDYVHIKDIVRAYNLVLDRVNNLGDICGVYNLGSGIGNTVIEVILKASEVLESDIPFSVTDRQEGDPAELVADITKAREVLGWNPIHNTSKGLEDIIRDSWEWLEKYPTGYGG